MPGSQDRNQCLMQPKAYSYASQTLLELSSMEKNFSLLGLYFIPCEYNLGYMLYPMRMEPA